ncbi:LytTR family DNA-binding domain-containing protein [Niabella drilacis]|uniref:LytTr DNA-binding domain-containing protein n=1 Tax=Niabella drilacis (strain DSM 25811 / CCM 8410 / CCUG 62505 / LMG 26954 / E90) TaxID=1285928 RepID=A0A1G6N6R4_NIADE|nr:LytTR family DNA-binding domain-containing protein [Niabella drilacis]SDC63552.1 LytTr DNA-binding domain-containing protein [Niabella drilacis]
MNRLIHTLKQPHPGYGNLRIYFRTVLGIVLIVFLILSILQPFKIGERNIAGNPYITAAVYAGGAFLTMSLNAVWLLVFHNWFRPDKWTLGKELIVMAYQFFSIGLTIWLINHLRGTLRPEDASFGNSFFLAIAIGILPYIIATFGRHNYLLKHHLKEVAAFNEQLKALQAQSNGQVVAQTAAGYLSIPKLDHSIAIDDFLFAESKGNNLVLQVCLNNRLQQYTLRSTLNDFAQANAHISPLFRCHRSFIINLDKVTQVQGNAAGYQVLLHPGLGPVVVARSSVPAFKKILAGRS